MRNFIVPKFYNYDYQCLSLFCWKLLPTYSLNHHHSGLYWLYCCLLYTARNPRSLGYVSIALLCYCNYNVSRRNISPDSREKSVLYFHIWIDSQHNTFNNSISRLIFFKLDEITCHHVSSTVLFHFIYNCHEL